jgi:ParB/RepB/Spo0J family partition protein
MNIELSKIKPSPKPIRTTWDDDKLDELAQSIEEQGLIVPIKVRPTDNNHYEIVYGHRRVEAMRIAGKDEIEAIVESLDDIPARQHALTENKVREDMDAYDVAVALQWEIEHTGQNQEQVGKKYGMSRGSVANYLSILKLDVDKSVARATTHKILQEASAGAGTDKSIVPDVIEKAAKEGLSKRQTRQVAESVAATKDPKMRERLIDAPYSPYTHDPEYAQERADRYGEHDPMARDKTPPLDEAWKLATEVSVFVDFIKKSRQMYEEVIKMDELGKFSPEARPFLVGKLKSTVRQIEKVIERLEG